MATSNRYKMSAKRLEELKEELNYLQTDRAREVEDMIRVARSFGDLSENSEYDDAKTEQGKLYSRIAEIKDLIENVELTEDNADTGRVGIGSTVTVKDAETGDVDKYKIVGSQEANPALGLISDDSPFGRGLMGHSRGETVTIDAPVGKLEFEIIEIE